MTIIEAPRGDVRAALAAVVPHAGKDTEETPSLGRVRMLPHPADDTLLVWATDHLTTGLARVREVIWCSEDVDGWDMPVAAVRKALAVFTGPSNRDAHMLWADQPMRIEVTDRHVTFTELGSIVNGESLTVDRIQPAGEDRYPDVPRHLTALAAVTLSEPVGSTAVRVDLLARFVPAAKAYVSADMPVVTVAPGVGLHRVLVRVGRLFLGDAPAYPEASSDGKRLQTEQVQWWTGLLEPLRRPEPVKVPDAVVEDLTRQAVELIRDSGVKFDGGRATTTLRVVSDRPLQ